MEQGHSKPILTQEDLLQHLFKIDSLIELILSQDLALLPMSKLYNCLLTIKNLTSNAIEINEKLLCDALSLDNAFTKKNKLNNLNY